MRYLFWISDHLLAAYPAAVALEFGAEMAAVHRQVLTVAAAAGPLALLLVVLREWGGLSVGLVQAHYEQWKERQMTKTHIQEPRGWQFASACLVLALCTSLLGYYFWWQAQNSFTPLTRSLPSAAALASNPVVSVPLGANRNEFVAIPVASWQQQLDGILARSQAALLATLALLAAALVGAYRRIQQPAAVRLLWRWAAFQGLNMFGLAVVMLQSEAYQFWLSSQAGQFQIGYHVTWWAALFLLGQLALAWWLALRRLDPPPLPYALSGK